MFQCSIWPQKLPFYFARFQQCTQRSNALKRVFNRNWQHLAVSLQHSQKVYLFVVSSRYDCPKGLFNRKNKASKLLKKQFRQRQFQIESMQQIKNLDYYLRSFLENSNKKTVKMEII